MTKTEFSPSHCQVYAGYFADGLLSPLKDQHQHSLVSFPADYSPYDDCLGHYEHYYQPSAPPVLPSSSSSELGHALVETPPPESQPINHGSITLPSISMPSSSVPKHELSETLAGLNAIKTEYESAATSDGFSPITSLSSLSIELEPHPKEEDQDQVHGFPSAGVPHGGRLHHRQHRHDSFCLVTSPAAYHSPPPAKVRAPPTSFPLSLMLTVPRGVLQRPPSLAIPGSLAYSPSAPMHTPLSSSFSSSDIGTPTSSIHLVDTGTISSSQAPAPVSSLAPNPKAGQSVLKLPSTKRSARHKPAIACLFCRERKIACGAPPVGSADPTCK